MTNQFKSAAVCNGDEAAWSGDRRQISNWQPHPVPVITACNNSLLTTQTEQGVTIGK